MAYTVKSILMYDTHTHESHGYSVAIMNETDHIVSEALHDSTIRHDKDWRWPLFATPEEAMTAYESGFVSDPEGNKYVPLIKTVVARTEGEK